MGIYPHSISQALKLPHSTARTPPLAHRITPIPLFRLEV